MLLPLQQNNLLAGAGNSQISGTTAGVATTTATLVAKGTLAGTSAGVAAPTALIRAKGALAGTSAGVAAPTALIRAKGALTGTSAGVAAPTALIRAKGALAGTSAGVASPTALIRAKGTLTGTSAGVATTTATLGTVPSQISGSIAGIASTTATLVAKGSLVGTIAGIASTTATLVAKGALVGTVAGIASTTATLTGIASESDSQRSGRYRRRVKTIGLSISPVLLLSFSYVSTVVERGISVRFSKNIFDSFACVKPTVAVAKTARSGCRLFVNPLYPTKGEIVNLSSVSNCDIRVSFDKSLQGNFEYLQDKILVLPPTISMGASGFSQTAIGLDFRGAALALESFAQNAGESRLQKHEDVFDKQSEVFTTDQRRP